MNVPNGQAAQVRETVDAANRTAYVWRCARCGRFLARIDRLDGTLEVYHKCGATSRLVGVIAESARKAARE